MAPYGKNERTFKREHSAHPGPKEEHDETLYENYNNTLIRDKDTHLTPNGERRSLRTLPYGGSTTLGTQRKHDETLKREHYEHKNPKRERESLPTSR